MAQFFNSVKIISTLDRGVIWWRDPFSSDVRFGCLWSDIVGKCL